MVVIATLSAPAGWRWLIGSLWLADCCFSWTRLRRGFARLHAVRLTADGEAWVMLAAGRSERAQLLSGSVVGRRMAWIRLRFRDGSAHAELFLASRAETAAWHRLQLIWRLAKPAFSDPGGP